MAMATDTEASFKGSMMDMVGFEMTRLAAQKAYRQAEVTPNDVQVIELHDCFSANEVRFDLSLSLSQKSTEIIIM
jgi:acetyl-CoA acetyltransferase